MCYGMFAHNFFFKACNVFVFFSTRSLVACIYTGCKTKKMRFLKSHSQHPDEERLCLLTSGPKANSEVIDFVRQGVGGLETHLVGEPAVRAGVPGDEVLRHVLHPAALLGAEVLCRQAHVPVGAGAQHGQEGHEVARAVHGELRRRGRPTTQ